MFSVRLRLLTLALAPLVILIPLLLLMGMARWTAEYDKVLIANVESDLRIAEQYLARMMSGLGDDLTVVAESMELAQVLVNNTTRQGTFFETKRQSLKLDFLYFLPDAAASDSAARWPVIASALAGTPTTQIDIFSPDDLRTLDVDLAVRARIELIETEAASPTTRKVEDRGIVVHSASPVRLAGQDGVLVGGMLLNRNLQFIDTINALVYLNAITGGGRQGTATLFLEDVRVSTNVRLFEDVRALGTRVSKAVRWQVLHNGETWLARAFVVNDWYVSGYLPLTDSFGDRVGMLYVGFREAPFATAKRDSLLWMLAAFAGVLLITGPVFLSMAKGIFAPLELMTKTMRQVGQGDLSARNDLSETKGEIGQVAAHLDDLLDQVQDRDARLRAWADDLNQRVEDRTSQLRDANAKLEDTYRQLVMSEKLASIGEIAAGVAHEINNPVAVIQGNVDVIRDVLGTDAAPVAFEMELIDQQVTRIEAIVDKLLKFSRPAEAFDQDAQTALAPAIGDCLVLVDHLLTKERVSVETHFDPVPEVHIVPGELLQVVINLITNALQAMKGQGRLMMILHPETRNGVDGATLIVRDTGPGIPADQIDKVFDPFFTTKREQGSGLGLSISQTIVQRAGGVIRVANLPEGGAEFQVWLPPAP